MVSELDLLLKPYDDALMKYNYKEHRYVLTVDGANASNLDLLTVMRTRENVNQYLDLLSRTLYSVFLKNTDSKLYEKKLWVLSHSKHYRRVIQQIFYDVVWFNFRSGGFMTLYQTGINMNEMKIVELTIESAMSVISNNMAQVGGINERTLRVRISRKDTYKTLKDLKDNLVYKGVYTEEELSEVVSYKEIPQTYDYIIWKDVRNGLVLEDFTYWKEQVLLMGEEW